jgi:hypothetical protein
MNTLPATTDPPIAKDGRPSDTPPGLLPHHADELRKGSGLSDETIRAAGIYSESSHVRLASILNRKKWDRKQGSAFVIPYRDETGTVVIQRVKPDRPPKRNGKVAKYLSPSGIPIRAYFPPRFHDTTHKQLLITEGEKKALKGTQEGFPTIGLSGVDCWHLRKSSHLLPELDRIAWQGVEVFLVFDSDATTNENVRDNERLLAAELARRSAKVKVVRLPGGPDGEKVGLDDFLVAHGASALHKLLSEAEEPEAPEPGELRAGAKDLNPESEAKAFLRVMGRGKYSTILYWRETWWRWQAGRFREVPESEMRAAVTRFLNKGYIGINRNHVANVLDQIKAYSILSGRTDPPVWLDDVPRTSSSRLRADDGGLLDRAYGPN